MITIFHNTKCGKSRCAYNTLKEQSIDFQVIEYLKNPPNIEEIKTLLDKLRIKPIELIRTKEPIFIEKYKGKIFSDEEWIQIIHENPILIERPILVSDNFAIIARSDEKIQEFITKL